MDGAWQDLPMIEKRQRVRIPRPKRNSGSVRRRQRAQVVRAAWRSLVAEWQQDDGAWEKGFGPPPNDPACLCPPDILVEFGLARGDPATSQESCGVSLR
ncbi:hypothetical protein ACWIGM_30905 [Bosea sp. NPDC055332]